MPPNTEMGYKVASSASAKIIDIGNIDAFASDVMYKSFYRAGRSKIDRWVARIAGLDLRL